MIWQRSTPSNPSPAYSFLGFLRRISNHLRWAPHRGFNPSMVESATCSGVGGQSRPSVNSRKLDRVPSGDSRPWRERLFSRLARVFGRFADSEGYVLGDPRQQGLDDAVLMRFQTGRSPEAQLALILESLELLDDADTRMIRARLAHDGGGPVPPSAATGQSDLSHGYGLAVMRFSERLAWVAARETLGMSPAQRRAWPGQIPGAIGASRCQSPSSSWRGRRVLGPRG